MNKGLIVGIDEYNNYPNLSGASNDAINLYNLLGEEYDNGIIGSFSRELAELYKITDDDNPERRMIIKMFSKMCKDAQKGDLILFYFAGHGFEFKGNDYLIFKDTEKDDPVDTGLSVDRALEKMEDSKASSKVLILDACRDEIHRNLGVNRFGHQTDRSAKSLEKIKGWEIITSCGPEEQARESSFGNKQIEGVFTHHFVKSVEELINKISDNINLFDVFTLANKPFMRKTSEVLKKQNPHYYCGATGSAILFERSQEDISHPTDAKLKFTKLKGEYNENSELIFKKHENQTIFSDSQTVHIVPFSSIIFRPDLEYLDPHFHEANQNFHVRLYLPKFKKGDKPFKDIYFFFNGLAETHPRIFDEIGWELASPKHNIPSVLIPLPGHFCRHPDFPHGKDDKFTIDSSEKTELKFHTHRILQTIYKHPYRIISGFKQIMGDANDLARIFQKGEDHYWSQIICKSPNIRLLGYSIGGLCALGLLMSRSKLYNCATLLESGACLDQVDAKDLFIRNVNVQKILWEKYIRDATGLNEDMESLFSINESQKIYLKLKGKKGKTRLELFQEHLKKPAKMEKVIEKQMRIFERHGPECRNMWEDILLGVYKVLSTGRLPFPMEENQEGFNMPLDPAEEKIFRRIFLGDETIRQKRDLDNLADRILLVAGGADEVFPVRKLLEIGPDSGLAMLQIPGLTHWIKYGSLKRWRTWKGSLVDLMESLRKIGAQ